MSVPLKPLLSHVRTKDALTELCGNTIVAAATEQQPDVVVAYRNKDISTQPLFYDQYSTHEEADTILIFHAQYTSQQGQGHSQYLHLTPTS